MSHVRTPNSFHSHKCANCGEARLSLRIPRGWWILVNGELACSVRCKDEAHEAYEADRLAKAFAELREQQRREELGIAQ